jgi:CheY-like chemotaxis protein
MSPSASKPLTIMPCVLVLEDNEAYRTLMTEVLSANGFDVLSAPDGRGVNRFLSQCHIDLIITDLSMPERDGIEILTELRYTHPHLPVIAISGDMPLNRELYLSLAEKLGAARVLSKPFKMDQLLAAAREALSTRKGPAAPDTVAN